LIAKIKKKKPHVLSPHYVYYNSLGNKNAQQDSHCLLENLSLVGETEKNTRAVFMGPNMGVIGKEERKLYMGENILCNRHLCENLEGKEK
jgi:hypothetical protein